MTEQSVEKKPIDVDKFYELAERLINNRENKKEQLEEYREKLRKLYMQHYMAHVHNNKHKHDKIVKKILSLGGHHECFANIDRGCEEW